VSDTIEDRDTIKMWADCYSPYSGETPSAQTSFWRYGDGGRGYRWRFNCNGVNQPPVEGRETIESFAAGDTVALWLDVDRGVLQIYKNGAIQARCTTLPRNQTYYVFATLDSANDAVQLSYGV